MYNTRTNKVTKPEAATTRSRVSRCNHVIANQRKLILDLLKRNSDGGKARTEAATHQEESPSNSQIADMDVDSFCGVEEGNQGEETFNGSSDSENESDEDDLASDSEEDSFDTVSPAGKVHNVCVWNTLYIPLFSQSFYRACCFFESQ